MIVDLFSGAGGVSQALRSLGRDDVVGVDNDAAAVAIARAAGHERLQWEDLRSPLMAEPMRYLLALDPDWFTLEQVPEAVSVWEEYAAHLSGWGWQVDVGVVNARWFGVPQDRERAFLVAHRWKPVALPTGPVVDDVPASTVLGPGTVGFARRADRPSNKAGARTFNRDGVEYRARDMRSTDLPCFTVTEKARSWSLVAPSGARRQITEAEAGRLQGFPADYPWPTGDRSATFLRIANAVPPPLYAGLVRDLIEPAGTTP